MKNIQEILILQNKNYKSIYNQFRYKVIKQSYHWVIFFLIIIEVELLKHYIILFLFLIDKSMRNWYYYYLLCLRSIGIADRWYKVFILKFIFMDSRITKCYFAQIKVKVLFICYKFIFFFKFLAIFSFQESF